MAFVGERRPNSIIEKNRFFKNDNRFSEKKTKLTSLLNTAPADEAVMKLLRRLIRYN